MLTGRQLGTQRLRRGDDAARELHVQIRRVLRPQRAERHEPEIPANGLLDSSVQGIRGIRALRAVKRGALQADPQPADVRRQQHGDHSNGQGPNRDSTRG